MFSNFFYTRSLLIWNGGVLYGAVFFVVLEEAVSSGVTGGEVTAVSVFPTE